MSKVVKVLMPETPLVTFNTITVQQKFPVLPIYVLHEMLPLFPDSSNQTCNTEEATTMQLLSQTPKAFTVVIK
jgi:hypothetical protein